MKRFVMAFLFIAGACTMGMAQTTTKTKNSGTIVKTKDNNGVKTKQNLVTGEVKKKDDMANTKTKTNSAATKTGMATPVPKEGTPAKTNQAKKKVKKTVPKTSK